MKVKKVPLRMPHAESVALIASDAGALLIRDSMMLVQLAEWFDLLWDEPATLVFPIGGQQSSLNPHQMRVLKMMHARAYGNCGGYR